MTCGRLTRVSSSSSARRRASPSGVSATAPVRRRRHGRGGPRRHERRRLRDRPRSARSARCGRHPSLRGRRLASGPVGVSVGHRDDARRWRGRLDRFDDQRPGQPGRASSTCRVAQVGPRQDDARIREPGSIRRRHAALECRQQRVLVFLGGGRGRPPDLDALERAKRLEPVAARRRPAIAELGPPDRRDPPPDRDVRGADVDDGLRRQPVRRQPGRQPLGCGSLAIETERLDPFDPLADAGQLDRRRGERSRQLEDEDPRSLGRHGSSPDGRTVRHQPDGAKERGGAGVLGHRPMVQVSGSRYGAAIMSRQIHG